ncbi:AI-2E family transporter [Halopiger thermotolerans]
MCALRQWDGQRAVWAGLGLVIAAAIGYALYAYIGTLLFAIFLYYATRPLYRHLNRHIEHPNVTATITILLIVLPMAAIIVYTGVVALRQLDQFLLANDLEAYRAALDPYLSVVRQGDVSQLRDLIGTGSGRSIASVIQQGVPDIVGRLSSIAGSIAGVLARFFLMLTFLFYLLRDDWKLRRWVSRSIEYDDEIVSYLEAVDDDLETVFVGNLAVIGVAAIIAAGTYFLLNQFASGGTVVGMPVLLAVLIGIGTLVPAVGMKIVYVPYGLYLLADAVTTETPLWQPIAFFALSVIVIDTIPDFFARSLLSARSGAHMGLVLLSYFLGTLAFGWYGLFLGPIVVVLAIHFADRIFPTLASTFLHGERPSGGD